jgi:hypothetical protein
VILAQGHSERGGQGGSCSGPVASRPTVEAAWSARDARDGAAASGTRGSTRTPDRVSWAQRGPVRQVKEGRNPPVRRGDGEVVWRFDAAARGSVLAREGVGGGVGEVLKLRGGKGEVRAASIREGRARRGHSPERDDGGTLA